MLENLINDNQYQTQARDTHLIQDTNFKKLITMQEAIYQETKVKPSIYKLVNLIISQADFSTLQEVLIKQYQ